MITPFWFSWGKAVRVGALLKRAGVTPIVTHLVPLLSTMARLSLVAFLALALSSVTLAAPPALQEIVAANDVHTTASWSYVDCGTWLLCPGMHPVELNYVCTKDFPPTSFK